jgi:urease accessory protein
MLRSMHLIVTEGQAPFEPEGGAYLPQGHQHAAHDPGHDPAHDHDHGHGHGHGHRHE